MSVSGLGQLRRWTVAPVAVLAVLLAGPGAVQAQGAPAATAVVTEAGVLEAEPSTLPCAAVANAAAPSPDPNAVAPAAIFNLVSEESAARYRAQEELAGVGATEAVGETNAIIGSILFDEAGAPLACTRFDVDLRTLTSDQARRDNYLYNNTLQTEQYPLATFVLTEVQGLDGALPEGEETTFFLIGNLTVHGVTKLVAWESTATLDGDGLEGTASTTFDMPDFGIEPPVVGPVVSLDERVVLEVNIVAERAE